MDSNTNIGIASLLAVLVLMASMSSIARANEHGISLPQGGFEPVTVRISEGAVDWESINAKELLQVYVGTTDLCCEDRTPVAGRYTLDKNVVTFTPAFGFVAGQDYIARIQAQGMDEKLVPFNIPSETTVMEARVTEFYPSGDTLPENVLRFYIHFSVPMSPHVAFNHIKLRDASGKADEAAFMKFKQELWNEDRTRLTVLIDPGRIKRDVATNIERGPALLEGESYTLSVEDAWPSANGSSLLPRFSKTFRVGQPLRKQPNVKFWQSNSPCIGTKEPLTITFDRPFDRHLLGKHIHIATGDGQLVSGLVRVGVDERSWSFAPREIWTDNKLQVVADTELEDVAGNNFRDLLDQTVSNADSDAPHTTMTVTLERCSR